MPLHPILPAPAEQSVPPVSIACGSPDAEGATSSSTLVVAEVGSVRLWSAFRSVADLTAHCTWLGDYSHIGDTFDLPDDLVPRALGGEILPRLCGRGLFVAFGDRFDGRTSFRVITLGGVS